MSRSRWKVPFIDTSILKFFFSSNSSNSVFKTSSRCSVITSALIGLRFRVYNGKDFIPLVVSESMVGHKIGEFIPTRAR